MAKHSDSDIPELHDIYQITKLIDLQTKLLYKSVAKARKAGHSWAKIGLVLGTPRQAARSRFYIRINSQDEIDEL